MMKLLRCKVYDVRAECGGTADSIATGPSAGYRHDGGVTLVNNISNMGGAEGRLPGSPAPWPGSFSRGTTGQGTCDAMTSPSAKLRMRGGSRVVPSELGKPA